MQERLNQETVKAVRQVVDKEFTVDECRELENELLIGKDGLRKGQVGKAYHSTGWKYTWDELVSAYRHFEKLVKEGDDPRRWSLAQLVVWSRCGNAPRAMRRLPKSWEELRDMEVEWLRNKGLDEMGFTVEPERALKARMRMMKKV